MRDAEMPIAAREARLAVAPVLDLDVLGTRVQARRKLRAQARASNDEAPAVALEAKPLGSLLLRVGKPRAQGMKLVRPGVQPRQYNLGHGPMLRQPCCAAPTSGKPARTSPAPRRGTATLRRPATPVRGGRAARP